MKDLIRQLRRTIEAAHAERAAAAARRLPDPVAWAEKVTGRQLDPWQRRVMAATERDILLNCSRQTGKSEVSSLRAAYRALHLKRRAVVLAPTERQSKVIFNRAKTWLDRGGAAFAKRTATELVLAGGGSVTALPGDRPDMSVRGDTVDDLMVDEASRVRDGLIAAATPTTATRPDATIVYLSTPAGRQGEFWRAWSEQPWWHKVTVTCDDCPRIPRAFLERERKRLGPLFAQEHQGEFLASAGSLFTSEDLDAMFEQPPVPGFDAEVRQSEPIW